MMSLKKVALWAALFSVAEGFSPVLSTRSAFLTQQTSALHAIRCEDKFYQLEELEDKDKSTTELYLRADRSVEFGQTDGPPFLEAAGNWDVEPGTNNFKMVLKRKFTTGQPGPDMGEFTYEIDRTYVGEMTKVGASVGITGVMHSEDDIMKIENRKLGFFNMIDATEERLEAVEN